MKCKICNSKSDRILNLDYYQCSSCDFIQMDDKNRVSFEEERKVYDYHNNSIEDKKYTDYLMDFFNRGVAPYADKGKLLDFGSGPSPVLAQLIERETDFDVDHYDHHYQPRKVYEGNQYDVIISTEVIEHFYNPNEMFELYKSLLKPGGILSVMTNFHKNDDNHFKSWWYVRDETHISFYNIKTLEKIAENFGFEIVYTDNVKICTMKKIK